MEAASYSSSQWSYDVFLSFMGKDTRHGFTAHLYEALRNSELKTFMDANDVGKGEKISSSLFTAIEKSMFCIVVLSENYASSTWCLDELVKILDCKSSMKWTVLPVFYRVDPSDVLEQKGSFAEAMADHEQKMKEMERAQIWKEALTNVASLCGWDARDKPEPMLIKEIVTHISRRLGGPDLVINEAKGVVENQEPSKSLPPPPPKDVITIFKKLPKTVEKGFTEKISKPVVRHCEEISHIFGSLHLRKCKVIGKIRMMKVW